MMSKLSVDAAIFIPSQSSSSHLAEVSPCLPQYLTTCYPFVQGDPGMGGKRTTPVYQQLPVTSPHPPLTSHPFPPPPAPPPPPPLFPVQNVFPSPQNLPQQFATDVQYPRAQALNGVPSRADRARLDRPPRPALPYGNRGPWPGRHRLEGPIRRPRQYNSPQPRMANPRLMTRMSTNELSPTQNNETSHMRNNELAHYRNNETAHLNGSFSMMAMSPPRDSPAQTDAPPDPGFAAPPSVHHNDVIADFSTANDDSGATSSTAAEPFHPPTAANGHDQTTPTSGQQRMSYASVAKAPPPPPPQPISAAESSKPETESTSESHPVKKRRKRSRKKKTKDGDTDTADERAISPEPIVLAAADLRFEDENEFPGLLQNTENLFNKYSSQPVMPYSTVLTGRPVNSPWTAWTNHQSAHATSQLVQPISLSSDEHMHKSSQSGMRSGSGYNSNTSSTRSLDKAGKENKVTRKRRKRRELANEAAEKELLEISLEQQVLKQIGLKGKKPVIKPQPAQRKSKEPVALNIAEMISALENQQVSSTEDAAKAKPKGNKERETVTETKPRSAAPNLLDANPSLKRGKEREIPKNKKPSTLKKVILKEREDRRRMRWMDETNLGAMTQFDDVEDEDGQGAKCQDAQSGELSPVSQTSPISMSPISPGGSPLSSEVTSPIQPGFVKSAAAMSIHSRRFREYCNQILDKEIDDCCVALLQDLVRFQDRVYHKEPNKVKSKRRFVLGLREVTKHLRLKKIKCVIISPNLERIQSKGGLDEALNAIISLCQEQVVPFVFALGRRALGRACAKLVPVSVVGVFNYDGSETNYHKLIELTEKAREQYNKMIKELEVECEEANQKPPPEPAQVYAHMGHSRTPSGCSGISFASSMMSEPISELGRDDVTKLQVPEKSEYFRRAHLSHSRNSSLGKVSIVESITEADESHYEADTEEPADSLTVVPRRGSEFFDDDDVDTIEDLPTLVEVDQAQDQLSCSSRTLSTTLQMNTATSSEMNEDCGGLSHRLKVIDQERIESWVEKAASSIQHMRLEDDQLDQTSSSEI